MVAYESDILNPGGESPYDMVRRGKLVPPEIQRQADRLFRGKGVRTEEDCGVKPLFPEQKKDKILRCRLGGW